MSAPAYVEKIVGNLQVVKDAAARGGTITAVSLTTSGINGTTSITTGLTAHSGGGQGSAVALPSKINVVSTVAAAGDSVLLPPATGSGAELFVANTAATNSMNVFPSGTDTIDGGSASAAVAVAATKRRLFFDVAVGTWISLLGA